MSREFEIILEDEYEEMVNQMEAVGAEVDIQGLVENGLEENFRRFKAQQYAQQDIEDLL